MQTNAESENAISQAIQARSQKAASPSEALSDLSPASLAQRRLAEGIHESPRMLQQKADISGMVTPASQETAVQRQTPEEEKPVQGRFGDAGQTAQRFTEEEEKPAQGRFADAGPAVQRVGVEEEKPMQGRFADAGPAVQRVGVEEEKPMQGRFADAAPAVQRMGVEEEKPMQGRFTDTGPAVQRVGVEEEKPMQGRFADAGPAVQRVGEEEEKPMQGRFADAGPAVQRVGVEEEKPMQGRFADAGPAVQRVGVEEEKPMQGRFADAGPAVQRKENRTGLPDSLKSGIENLSGMSMDSVKVHYNSDKPAQLNALAHTQGTDIHVAPGQEQHLAHEAWHVVQQAQGRVQATMQMKEGVPVNDDPGLEHEADVMGAKALQQPG